MEKVTKEKILYVAGPMTGYVDFNYPAFEEGRRALQDKGYGHVLSPTDSELINEKGYQQESWEWYLRKAIEMVVRADGIALLPGWENSKGALLEKYIGEALHLEIRPIEDWLAL